MKATSIIMGLPVTVEVLDRAASSATCEQVFAMLRGIDEQFSTYKTTSEISRINRGELAIESASPLMRQVLAACERLRGRTDGYFEIRHNNQIDPSGYVKGWAIWKASRLLSALGMHRYNVEAGGDMQLCGEGPRGKLWRVGIRNPLFVTTFAKVVELTDLAVATSGTYERGAHIYNPRTAQAVTDVLSLSVIGPRIDEVDALATAAFAMGLEGLTWLARQGVAAMMITPDGQVSLTRAFSAFVVNQ